ncbi:MAG: T9SS type A sorting domain-containing protein [Saprospiraceae bacterium]|nr:T9SS type A sorting domain-containing protein [Saprospiraceae bacterium]
MANGGVIPYMYSWLDLSNNQSSNYNMGDTISGQSAGTYVLTIIDNAACTIKDTISITEPSSLVSNLSFQNESGAGASNGSASVNPAGGTPSYLVSWSTGATGNQISNLSPGTYTVTITDFNLCTLTESFIISPGDCNLAAISSVQEPSCFGGNDGTITIITSNSNPPVTYSWSTGISSQSPILGDVTAGLYSVTVTDSKSCGIVISGIVVGQPNALITSLNVFNETKPNADDGNATAVISGGTSPYEVLWSNGETGPSIDSLAPGQYFVVVTDANDCSRTDSFAIMEAPLTDNDNDGYFSDTDCNDNDPTINPGATDIPNNGIDENCDGKDGTTSSIDLTKNKLDFYPNPTSGIIYFDVSNDKEIHVIVFNSIGKQLDIKPVKNALHLDKFQNGVYFVKVFDNNMNIIDNKKIILNK